MFNILILNKSNNTFTTICSVEDEDQLVEISENLQSCLPEYLQVDFEVIELEEELTLSEQIERAENVEPKTTKDLLRIAELKALQQLETVAFEEV